MNMQMQSGMSEEDMVKTLLSEEKRMAGEYATATLEANCQTVHDVFSELLQRNLQSQRQVFQTMSQKNWYSTPRAAQGQEIQKQIQQATQTRQQTEQMLTNQQSGAAFAANQAMQGSSPTQQRNTTRPM